MATKHPTIRRAKGEDDVQFMERAATAAEARGGSLDAGMGPLCPACAPFGTTAGDVAELLPYLTCYNCPAGQVL
jgi:hypothetical protein